MGWAQPWVNAGAVAFILFSVVSPLYPHPCQSRTVAQPAIAAAYLVALTWPLFLARGTG